MCLINTIWQSLFFPMQSFGSSIVAIPMPRQQHNSMYFKYKTYLMGYHAMTSYLLTMPYDSMTAHS